MKKATIVVAMLLAVILSVVCLAACTTPNETPGDIDEVENTAPTLDVTPNDTTGDTDESADTIPTLDGTWKFYSIAGEDWTVLAGEEIDGTVVYAEDYITLIVNSDGTFSWITVYEGTSTITGTWTKDGDTITASAVEFEGDRVFTLDGNTLSGEFDRVTVTFKKSN